MVSELIRTEVKQRILAVWLDRAGHAVTASPEDHCEVTADAVMEVTEDYRMISLVDVIGYRIDGKVYHPVDVDIEVRGK